VPPEELADEIVGLTVVVNRRSLDDELSSRLFASELRWPLFWFLGFVAFVGLVVYPSTGRSRTAKLPTQLLA
jgi:hypothetical protein